ncbi:tRNA (adenosine(37)-N6)-threonylcarbamoyltransferase complex dimerization subunit type 1 TsaB [Maribius pontilimi]|uniref:tRNA (Adenosine(37)-N6)-threonylcarbamoyltransferase complex dimerization subunit type 1 TsaB n=1 Tax=Palleronia pontilimi TaxID=1964209 RepID=A0A934MI60_9RHOB|nr:tRNA (adenosine(37)-N6)-threonylcarbamoyltransferase complex dimerization subunit type 1 TsaB [Palleronia pontilimi]MBJ3763954.1 tRNA (adenosine(37)-N6)-threonylcarbamoyltransferase complex dimerization subunit type 1 TsaB [Palleronia pontilimi]
MPDRSNVLAFDTSAAHCAAALRSGGALVAEMQEDMARGQAERLMPLLEELLRRSAIGWRDLDALAVGIGPGNFTGLRVGVAAARGLALGLGRPCHGVSTFDLALGGNRGEAVLVCLPAPHDMAYVQPFFRGRASGPAQLIDPARPPQDLQAPSGMSVTGPLAETVGRHFECFVDQSDEGPVAPRIAEIAEHRHRAGERPDRPAPLYVRPPDAAPARAVPPVV